MAPSSADIIVRPSASHEAEDDLTEENLIEELQLQDILLESLHGTEEDTPARKSQLQSTTRFLKAQLRLLRKQRDTKQKTLATMNETAGLDQAASAKMNGNRNHTSSATSTVETGTNKRTMPSVMDLIDLTNSGPPSPSANSQDADIPAGRNSSRNQGNGGLRQDRKRTYSKHLDAENPWLPENKSQRMTPVEESDRNTLSTRQPDNSDASSTSDPIGDEDQFPWLIDQQRKAEERYRLLKEQEEDDAYWARQLQFQGDELNSSSEILPFQNLPAQQPAWHGPNAFDRIQGRASQFSQQSQGHSSQSSSAPDANVAGSMSSPSGHRPSIMEIPSHVRAQHVSSPWGLDHSNRDEAQARSGALPNASGPSMPGSFDNNLYEGLFGADPFSNGSRGDIYFGDSPNADSPAADSDLEITGVAPVGYRPGTLVNGRFNLMNSRSSNSSNSLSDIINRTNNFDFQTGFDRLGNPIPDNTMNIVRGLHEAQSSYGGNELNNTDIRDLLANIPADTEPNNQADTPDGFKDPLYLHQKIALKWMQGMEADEKKKGGILADDMGLGKTITTLALILTRPSPPIPGSRDPHPTLIVAPVSLIKQWEREAMTKIEVGRHSLAVLNAHDPANKSKTYTHFKQYDIVLTTYDKLSREASKYDEYLKSQADKREPTNDDLVLKQFPFMGPRSMFHRVVLDEAQAVKNSKAQRFKAVRRIQATYRWCLTGTPMMNGVDELSSLISFLRIKPYNDLPTFKHAFGCLSTKGGQRWGKETAMKKLQTLLKAIMLRRTKQSKINGEPIIQLKQKIEMVDHVVFGGEEDSYYRDLERDSQVKISRFLREGLVGKHYTIALVLLLRLRQACCHPYLHITDLEFVNNDTPVKDMLANARKLKSDAVQRIVNRIKNEEPFECPICYDYTENPSILLCGHNTCIECLARLRQTAEAQNIQAGNEGAKSTCPECREAIDLNIYVTYDIFKQVHMREQWDAEQAAANGTSDSIGDANDGTDSDLSGDEYENASEDTDNEVDEKGNLMNFIVNDNDDNSDFSPAKKAKDRKLKKRNKSKRRDKKKEQAIEPHELAKLRKDAGKNAIARKRYMNYLHRIWLDSAKVTKCTEIISEIQASGEKTIVFSQWTLLLDLLEVQISKKLKLGYRRYDGAMSSAQRDSAVTDFTNDPDCKVMLISLKAGNAGLNLTMASQVIIMDPFWNPFIENQAVDRAYRIGQTKDVKVHRVLVQNTVEDRIVELQDRKRELVNAALDENAAQAIGRLSANDLAFLFGVGGR